MSPQKGHTHFCPLSSHLTNGLMYALQSWHLTIGSFLKLTCGTSGTSPSSPWINIQLVHKRVDIECTYRWEIAVWFDYDAEWNAGVFACFVSAWNSIRSAPHQWFVGIEKCIVDSRLLNNLRLLLYLLLFERLLHGIIAHLWCLLRATGRLTWMHICILVLTRCHLCLLHLLLRLLAEWLCVTLSRELKRKDMCEQKLFMFWRGGVSKESLFDLDLPVIAIATTHRIMVAVVSVRMDSIAHSTQMDSS